jgi:hypothetical protein
MPVAVLLQEGGVAFVVVAVLDAPVSADGLRGAHFVPGIEAREEKAGVGFGVFGIFLFAPLASHGDGGASPRAGSRAGSVPRIDIFCNFFV